MDYAGIFDRVSGAYRPEDFSAKGIDNINILRGVGRNPTLLSTYYGTFNVSYRLPIYYLELMIVAHFYVRISF